MKDNRPDGFSYSYSLLIFQEIVAPIISSILKHEVNQPQVAEYQIEYLRFDIKS